MAEILKIKFRQCAEFRNILTSSKGYIAHNFSENVWGTGTNGRGMNVFGLLLAALSLGACHKQ